MLVEKVAALRQLHFVNLKGEFKQNVAFMDGSSDMLWVHVLII